jgi:hypothetical protein
MRTPGFPFRYASYFTMAAVTKTILRRREYSSLDAGQQ